METFFLLILIITMIAALASGFPVAFALPGSAIVSIGLASIFGFIFHIMFYIKNIYIKISINIIIR